MKARKRKNSGGNMRRHRVLRIDALSGTTTITRSRGIWYAHKQSWGGADIGPQAHHRVRNAFIPWMSRYLTRAHAELLVPWQEANETGDFTRFFKLYRAGRHTMFLLAGVHLACLRRAGYEVRA